MTQKFSKVNVKHMPCVSKHYVIIVAVTNSQDISSHATSCTRVNEVFWSLEGRGKKVNWDQISVGKQHSYIQQAILMTVKSKPDKTGPNFFSQTVCFNQTAFQKSLDHTFQQKWLLCFSNKLRRSWRQITKETLAEKRVQGLFFQCVSTAL